MTQSHGVSQFYFVAAGIISCGKFLMEVCLEIGQRMRKLFRPPCHESNIVVHHLKVTMGNFFFKTEFHGSIECCLDIDKQGLALM